MTKINHEELESPVTNYFTGLAQVYAQHRPSYPIEAIDWILEKLPKPLQIVDIGCGTGISSRLLASRRGGQIIGIDPNADMLEQARAEFATSNDTIRYQLGTGEDTGLADASCDLIVCAQSFHWFNQVAALREFHRTLRPQGRLALLWNVKDDNESFSAAFGRLAKRAQADTAASGRRVPLERATDVRMGGYFANVRQHTFANPQLLTLEGVLGRARSASYFPKSDPLRSQLEADLREAFDLHQRDQHVTLLHQTEVTLADRA